MSKLIRLQAILRDKGALQDGTRKIVMECQEAEPEDLTEILRNNGQIGWFLFSPELIKEEDIPTEPPTEFKTER